LLKALPATLPQLETERLKLRSMRSSDIYALFGIYGDPEVMRYASDKPFPEPATVLVMLKSVENLLAGRKSLEWGIEEKHSAELVGTCGLHSFDPSSVCAEVGCMLARNAWGKGIMQEALQCVLEYAWQTLGLNRLLANIDASNSRSIRLFTALGFKPVNGMVYELILKQSDVQPTH
jgi:[ribosomal protein S5]-alanine N-acetyltransferase